MLKLFQTIFGRKPVHGIYPEPLIEEAIERAVEFTDPRLRALPGYRKKLRDPVISLIDHVVALVDALPVPIEASRAGYGKDPRLAALFATPDHMMEVFSMDANLRAFLAEAPSTGERVTALLLSERIEKSVLGMDLVGDTVRSDVAQTSVSFASHRLVDPAYNVEDMRKLLRHRAFDHILTLALARIVERREGRADLQRQRELLKLKLGALERGADRSDSMMESPEQGLADLRAELNAIETQAEALGTHGDVLEAHLDIVLEVLSNATQQLWYEPVQLYLDQMNIKRSAQDPAARSMLFQELHNPGERHFVVMLLSIAPEELPEREHYLDVAQRYLI